MGHIQKIILLVLIVPLALFPGGLISYFLLFEKPEFENTMWIPIGMTALGLCSFMFHFKTKMFYKLLKKKADLPKIDPLFWLLDIAFGIVYILISFYLVYLMYILPVRQNAFRLLLYIIPLFIAGLWTVFEAFYLHNLIQIHKFAHRHAEIDDIKGNIRD
ncbi:hypothetical protein LX77_02404 [Gelidibacter algens]|uniref:Uncharacterized protein n=1 Tax=Gelidibacter algens TaxID=49280 RepID=A0A1A7R1T0_9FLAO|nr:hypothetical protein [Gelidibacter algens]OBX26215.1 hypothetical protein A9996_05390 [Gelidibacter algens]RAJ22459.1 hypothetical protein LX77_02404 [Gelidibacter algens]